MTRIGFTLILFLHCTLQFAQDVEWFRERGVDTNLSLNTSQATGRILLNDDGSLIALGSVSAQSNSVIDLDPGPDVFNYTHTGHISAVVQRFSSEANLDWTGVFRSGISTFIYFQGIEGCMNYIDDDGSIYLFVTRNSGSTTTLEYLWNGQLQSIGSFGYSDSYLIKLADDGELIWNVRLNAQNPAPKSLYVKDDKLYLYGAVTGTKDFDPRSGVFTISIPSGVTTNYITQLDTSGVFQNARTFYNSGQQSATVFSYALSVNSLHELVIELRLVGGPIDLDLGAGTEWVQSPGAYTTYLLKLDSNWNYSWHHEWNYPYFGQDGLAITQVAFDQNDQIITTGLISGDIYFNTWNSSHLSQNPLPHQNLFVAKFSPLGIPSWHYRSAAHSQSFSQLYTESLGVSKSDGSIIVTGHYRGDSIGLNPFDSLDLLPPVAFFENDFGLQCVLLDSSGEYQHGFGLANDSVVRGTISLIHDQNTFYLQLYAKQITDIDPGQDVAWIGTSGVQSDHISCTVKYNRCLSDTGLIQDFNCGSYVFQDTTFYESGVFEYAIQLENGCDSIVIIDLQIGEEYYTSVDTVLCTPTFLGVQLIEEAGEYTYFGTTQDGCDSHIVWNVTYPEIDSGIQFFPELQKLKSKEDSADHYQWYACDSAGLILLPGDTSQAIIKSNGGSYAVVIEIEGCSDTSACINIFPSGVGEESRSVVNLYPNPAEDMLTVTLGATSHSVSQIRIYNTAGQLVLEDSFRGSTTDVRVSDVAAGVYHLEVLSDGLNDVWRTKLVVE
ncbi:MAG: T9SS type A sorting domain-containing protein [Flavobacteriales bacterium]|nr:T9SS type A sorting domain-containing protein [Flavobacteriales bacterium]